MFKNIIRYLELLIFPPDCPFCKKIMYKREEFVCKKCVQTLPFFLEPRCLKCGREVARVKSLCQDCMENRHVFTEGRAVFKYQKPVSDAILRFKYHGRKSYGEVFSFWMYKAFEKWIVEREIDVIIPVPVHLSRRRKRGYNQAELLAEKLAKRLGICCNGKSVIRCKKTIPQKKLTVFGRMENMQRAFVVVDKSFVGKNVLIVDDIYTTGMTVNILSLCILKSGAKKVYFAALSQGV